jgi:hypothetical protein
VELPILKLREGSYYLDLLLTHLHRRTGAGDGGSYRVSAAGVDPAGGA